MPNEEEPQEDEEEVVDQAAVDSLVPPRFVGVDLDDLPSQLAQRVRNITGRRGRR